MTISHPITQRFLERFGVTPKKFWKLQTAFREIRNYLGELDAGLDDGYWVDGPPPGQPWDPHAGLGSRLATVEHILSDLIEVVTLRDPDPQPNRLSESNLFRSIGGADERKAALEDQIERLEKATTEARNISAVSR